jgi:hypothetical protein
MWDKVYVEGGGGVLFDVVFSFFDVGADDEGEGVAWF